MASRPVGGEEVEKEVGYEPTLAVQIPVNFALIYFSFKGLACMNNTLISYLDRLLTYRRHAVNVDSRDLKFI